MCSQLNPRSIIKVDMDNNATALLRVVEEEQSDVEQYSTFLLLHQTYHPPSRATLATTKSGNLILSKEWKALNTLADAPTADNPSGKTQQEEASIAPNPLNAAKPPSSLELGIFSVPISLLYCLEAVSFVVVISAPIVTVKIATILQAFLLSTNYFSTSILWNLNIPLGHRYQTMSYHTSKSYYFNKPSFPQSHP